MAKEKKTSKRVIEKYEREVLGISEPTEIRKDTYKTDLMLALNHYNVNVDNKTKRKWTLDYLKKNDISIIPKVSELGDFHFTSVGSLIRMKTIGLYLEENELSTIDTLLSRLINEQSKLKSAKTTEVKEEKPQVNVQDKVLNKAREFAGELDYLIDMYLIGQTDTLPDLSNMLLAANLPKLVANHIPKFYDNLKNELIEAAEGKDEQLNEGYSHLSKSKLKKASDFVCSISNIITNYGIKVKVNKPRAVKQKSPLVLVKNLKYKSEDIELKLKSINPIDIIGASEVWLYNTKYRKLIKYSGSNISVKGTTLTNFEPDDSSSKTLRKPDILPELLKKTKKQMMSEFKDIKATISTPNGRINSDTLILKVF